MIVNSPAGLVGSMLPGVAANVALLLGSYEIARHGVTQPRGLPAVLATAVVFWVACTLGLELVGVVGALSAGPMLAWGLCVCAIGLGLRWVRTKDRTETPAVKATYPLSWDAIVCLALVLSVVVVLGMRSLLLGVKVVSDGPIYHLYFAARWWKAGRLFLVASPFGENAATYFPANGDLWFSWLMVTWGGERLAKLGQAPFLVLAGLAAFGCAPRLGACRSASAVATCWFVSSTPLLLFSFEPNVDTIFVAGYLMAAYFFLRASTGADDTTEATSRADRQTVPRNTSAGTAACCLGALAAGCALGTKSVGVIFVPPLLAIAVAAVLTQPVAARTRTARIFLIGLAPLVSGGFWYIRNAVMTGNPLYPLELRALGRTVLPGWYQAGAMNTSPYYLPVHDGRALGDIVLAVLDPRLAPLWFASLFAGWIMTSPKTSGRAQRVAIFSFMAVLNVVLYWGFIPYRTQQRFMLQALGLAVVPLAMTLDRSRWLLHAAVFLLALHVLTPQGWPFTRRMDRSPGTSHR